LLLVHPRGLFFASIRFLVSATIIGPFAELYFGPT
jgi:hypothetical protein